MPEEKKKRKKTVEIETPAPVDALPPEQEDTAPQGKKKPRKSAFSYLFEESDADPYDVVYEQHSKEEEQISKDVEKGFGQAVDGGEREGYQPAESRQEEAAFVSSSAQPQPPRDLSLFEEEGEEPRPKRSLFDRLRRKKKETPEQDDSEEIFDLYRYEPVKTEIEEEPGLDNALEKDLEEEELNFFHQLTGQFQVPEEHRQPVETEPRQTARPEPAEEPQMTTLEGEPSAPAQAPEPAEGNKESSPVEWDLMEAPRQTERSEPAEEPQMTTLEGEPSVPAQAPEPAEGNKESSPVESDLMEAPRQTARPEPAEEPQMTAPEGEPPVPAQAPEQTEGNKESSPVESDLAEAPLVAEASSLNDTGKLEEEPIPRQEETRKIAPEDQEPEEDLPDGPDLAPPLEHFVHLHTEPFPEEDVAAPQAAREEEQDQVVDISSMGNPRQEETARRRVEGAFLVAEGMEPVLIYTPPRHKVPLDTALGGGVTEHLRGEYQQYSPEQAEPAGHPIPAGSPRRKHGAESEKAAAVEAAPEVPEDYRSREDAVAVRRSISQLLKRLFLQGTATALLGVFLAALALLGRMGVMLSGPFSMAENPAQYLTVNLVALVLAMLVCIPTILGGIKSLFTLRGDADTAVSWACMACLVQILCGYGWADSFRVGEFAVFAPVAVLLLFLNTLGKFLIMKRTQKNFRFVSSSEPKYAVRALEEGEVEPRLVTEEFPAPVVAYTVKSGFLDNFLRISYRYDEGETASQKISLYTSAGALAMGLVSYLVARNIGAALAAFAAAACMGVPAANMLVANAPVYRAVKKLLKKGVMLAGTGALEEFGDCNYLMLEADELFPKNAVVLNVIKTFSQLRVDEAIVDAAALVCAMGGPMADMFNRIIQGRANILPKVDSFAFEEGMGAIGWVSGRRILVGNRELLLRHGIQPPSRDYEQKYTLGGRCTTYLAAGGDLVAMFVMSYSVEQEVGKALSELCRNGVKLLVRSKDVNVTAGMVEEGFGLPEGSVMLLTDELARTFDSKTEKPAPSSDAYLGVSGRLCATCKGISACIRLKNSIALAVLLQLVGVFLGLALVLVLALSGGIAQLGVLEMLSFGLFWVVIVLLIPALRRS